MIERPPKFSGFPRRENCDPSDPYQAFLWMLVALPGQNGGPLVMPVNYLQLVSKQLWDLGARPVEQPTLEWVAPTSTDPHWMTSPGKWVAAGTAPVVDEHSKARDALERMSQQQRAEVFEVLVGWESGQPIPDTPAGNVCDSLSERQKRIVLEVMRA